MTNPDGLTRNLTTSASYIFQYDSAVITFIFMVLSFFHVDKIKVDELEPDWQPSGLLPAVSEVSSRPHTLPIIAEETKQSAQVRTANLFCKIKVSGKHMTDELLKAIVDRVIAFFAKVNPTDREPLSDIIARSNDFELGDSMMFRREMLLSNGASRPGTAK